MNRDMDLVRELLLAIDKDPVFDGTHQMQPDAPDPLGITDRSYEEVAYHLVLLIEAGMVAGRSGTRMPIITRLTWQGHDFLDSVRDPKVWHGTKECATKAGGFTVEILSGIAKDIIKDNLVRIVGSAFGA